jgi:ABC-type multidrug transport system ATPase subunit
MTILEIRELRKRFGPSTHVLNGINLKVEQGEFLGVIGLSGSG